MSERASTKGRETADDVGIRAIPARTRLTKAQAARAENITIGQVLALEWLFDLRCRFPKNDYGFNPTYRPRLAATCRRSLEGMGLVYVRRLSPQHFRYAITAAGIAVLRRVNGPEFVGKLADANSTNPLSEGRERS